jgi:hypothetical protein
MAELADALDLGTENAIYSLTTISSCINNSLRKTPASLQGFIVLLNSAPNGRELHRNAPNRNRTESKTESEKIYIDTCLFTLCSI